MLFLCPAVCLSVCPSPCRSPRPPPRSSSSSISQHKEPPRRGPGSCHFVRGVPRGRSGPTSPSAGLGDIPPRVPGPPPTPDPSPHCPAGAPPLPGSAQPHGGAGFRGCPRGGGSRGSRGAAPVRGGVPRHPPPTPRRAAVPLNGGAAPVAEGAVAVADITRGREHLRPARLRHRHRHRSAPGRAGTGAGAGRPRRPPRYAPRRMRPADGDTGTHRDPLLGWDDCTGTPGSIPGPPETGPAAPGPPALYRDLPNPPGASSRRGTPAPGSAAPYREGTPHPPATPPHLHCGRTGPASPHRDPLLPPPPPEPVSLPGPAQRGPAGAA